jgi:cytochrome c oxidase assembly factor CtaG
LLVATSSGIGRYTPAVLGAHVASHTLLAVLVSVQLVAGGLVTLALRALPAGGRDAVAASVGSPLCWLPTRPAVASTLLAGPFYLLYVGGVSPRNRQPTFDRARAVPGLVL